MRLILKGGQYICQAVCEMKTINILFLGGGKRVSLAKLFKKVSSDVGREINILSYELDKYVPISSEGKVIKGLKWNDTNLIKHLKHIVKTHAINIVLPFVDPAVRIAAILNDELDNVHIPVSNKDMCSLMFNKSKAACWLDEQSLPVPEIYDINKIVYPVIFKPVTGSASKGIIVVHSPDELSFIKNPENYLIQKYIEKNEEYTVDCFVSNMGEIISVVPRIRLETAGGEVVRSRTVKCGKIIQFSKSILAKGKFIGPITIQFLKDLNDGNIYVMEINPRFGGGAILSIMAGANTPKMIINEYLNVSNAECWDWRENTLMTRYFKEVIFDAVNN